MNEHVARGIKYMDDHGPADWRDRINLDTLDIGNPMQCVFGQVYSNECEFVSGWSIGVDKFYDLMHTQKVDIHHSPSWYGFDSGFGDALAELNIAWREVLSAS